MDSEISHQVEIFKEVSRIPCPVSALILPGLKDNLLCIHSAWSAQDLVSLEKNVFTRDYVIEQSNLNVLSNGIISHFYNVLVQAFSKSGKRQAILQERKCDEKMFLEIFNISRKEITFDMSDRKEHGKIIWTDSFGCFNWSSDEKYLLYCAEKKRPKSVSYFKDTSANNENESTVKGEEYLYREEWGEGFAGLHHSVLCILEVETGVIEVLPSELDTEISVGQAVWGPNDESVVFVGWKELPCRLGVYACMNRRSSIYAINLKSKEIECITAADNICACSPCFSPNFDALIYVDNEADGTHLKCSRLRKYDCKTKKLSTVVDIVKSPADDEFPGLYEVKLPMRCWSEDGKHIFFSSIWRSRIEIICVNIDDGNVKRVETGKEYGASKILDVQGNLIVAQVSSPDIEPCLIVGNINEKDKAVVKWKFLDATAPVKHLDIKWNITKLIPSVENEKYPNLDYEIIVISPTESQKKNPLIIIPHGGPHCCYPAIFPINFIGFVKAGYIICMVNYRGSLGFGENNVNSLPGNVGDQDVADVQNAAIYMKNNNDIGDIFILGGSHGGFLGAHLCGQFPEFYKAACLKNPVIDISNMIGVSDIPDWCWVEGGCGMKLDPSFVVLPDHISSMWEKSPIKHAGKISTPILLLLGTKDKRVPMSQGLHLYNILKARNIPVRVHMYDDNHRLSKTPHDGDGFLQTCLWFKNNSSSAD